MTSIAPAGSISSEASAINESGVIAGSYEEPSGDRRGFIVDDGDFTLDPRDGRLRPRPRTDINESGQVVGTTSRTPMERGASCSMTATVVDLNTQIPLGLRRADQLRGKIADDGTILVGGHNSDGRDKPCLLVPTTPNPIPDP